MTIAEFQEKGEAALKACLLEVDAVSNLDDLNVFKGRHLGKKSALTGFYQMMRSVDPAERKEFGILLSRLKDKIEAVYAKKASEIEAKLLSEKMARKRWISHFRASILWLARSTPIKRWSVRSPISLSDSDSISQTVRKSRATKTISPR